MNIKEVIIVFNTQKIEGVQLSKRNGIISSTWLLYKKFNYYYYFDVNQKIEFIDRYKYSEDELLNEFQYSIYEIDLTIN